MITGRVTSKYHEPIIGANIIVKGTNIGTIADINGNYRIRVDSNHRTLRFSFWGYYNLDIDIDGKTQIDVMLDETPFELQEIIVKDFTIQTKMLFNTNTDTIFGKKGKIKSICYDTYVDTTKMKIEKEKNIQRLKEIDVKRINDSINSKVIPATVVEKHLREYIIEAIEYPKSAKENGVSGKLIVEFTINEHDSIEDIKTIRSFHPSIEQEVINTLTNMPKSIQIEFGKYGVIHGQKVPKKYIIPFKFILEEFE